MCLYAIITGGARRIGASIATYLHDKGFSVLVHCNTSQQDAIHLVTELNKKRANSAKFLAVNLDSEESCNYLLNTHMTWAHRLDVLINNASIFSKDYTRFDEMLLLNVKIPFLLSNKAFPYLQATKGSVINITDTHAKKPLKEYAVYCQTKAALSMQTKALATEFSPDVRVNAVAPGAILWPEGENNLNQHKKDMIIHKTLLKKSGRPINIAKAVYALLDNDFITGQELVVDGGRNL